MGKLAPGTVNNYRSRLKKLRNVLPLLSDDNPERPYVLREIEKLTNQLGIEMNDLEIALARGPGRPRSNANVNEFADALKPSVKTALTPEEVEQKRHSALDIIRQNVLRDNPELAREEELKRKERESELALRDMINLANESLGGDTNGNADESSTIKRTD